MTGFAVINAQISSAIDNFYSQAPENAIATCGKSFLYSTLLGSAFTGCIVAGVMVGTYAAVASLVYTLVSPLFESIAKQNVEFYQYFGLHYNNLHFSQHLFRVLFSNVIACCLVANEVSFPVFFSIALISNISQTIINGGKNVSLRKEPLFIGPMHLNF